ncbi:MAG: hypothetical protein IJ066_06305, partial [Bacteroidaceae bacterium]|nr:hypothetical protein [Bacteroidaceae bacterium]
MRTHLSILLAFLLCSVAGAAAPTVSTDVPARLHWIGKVPEGDKPVSFGIPFSKGELKPSDSFALTTDKGEVLPADFWPTAYWPDGSVKWGGFATVVPGGTEGVVFERKEKKGKEKSDVKEKNEGQENGAPGALSVSETDRQICIRAGSLEAYIPKSGNAVLDSLVLDGRRLAGHGLLVCTTQDAPYLEGIGSISFRDFVGAVSKVTVERAGDVRAVVKVEGSYGTARPGEKEGFLPFTVRLYFYAGSEQVRMVHTFIYNGDQHRDFIRSLGVRFEVPLREQAYNRHVAFAT